VNEDRVFLTPDGAKLMQLVTEGQVERSVVVYPLWAVTPFVGGHVYDLHGLTEERAHALAVKFGWIVLTKNLPTADWHSA